MSWKASILVAVVAAVPSAIASGVVASLYIEWYHVSTREGGAGYLVIFIALLAFAAGAVFGLIIARVVLGREAASTFRLLTDIPPTIRGEPLMLRAEVRWPLSQRESPAPDTVRHTDRKSVV